MNQADHEADFVDASSEAAPIGGVQAGLLWQQLMQLKLEERELRFAAIPSTALLWMTLAQQWTTPLAQAARFPTEGQSHTALLSRMTEVGIATVEQSRLFAPSAPENLTYTVKPAVREEVFKRFQHQPQVIEQALVEIGSKLRQIDSPLPGLTRPLQRWAELAATVSDSETLTRTLRERINAALDEDEPDMPEARRWVDAAQLLFTSLFAARLHKQADALELMLRQVNPQLDLFYEREVDRHKLVRFCKREEQLSAFRELMVGTDDYWALHYVGGAGVGKSMLLKYIDTMLTDEDHYNVAVARIDFDYLNADYPRRDPGLLLIALARNLRAFDPDGTVGTQLDRAEQLFNDLRQSTPLALISAHASEAPLFQQALSFYIAALKQLGRPVLLILDTCEELGRYGSPGIVENVEWTLRVLSALHDGPAALNNSHADHGDGFAALRVVFAGRRLLAGSGKGWRCCEDYNSPLPHREYLRLHQILGFREDEAQDFLSNKLEVPANLVEVVLKSSDPDLDIGSRIVWTNSSDKPAEVARYNPEIISQHAYLIKELPTLAPADLLSDGSSSYVKSSIIDPIARSDDRMILPVLPWLALLGHVDRVLLQQLLPEQADQLDEIFSRLSEEYWIERRLMLSAGSGKNLPVLDVKPGMRQMLLKYYENSGTLDLRTMERQIARYLEEITLTGDLGTIEVTYFDTMLRMLVQTPEEGSIWWRKVEARILVERGWQRLFDLTGHLIGQDGVAAERHAADPLVRVDAENPLRPLILASHAAAILHTSRSEKPANVWQEVAQGAPTFPVVTLREELRLRAFAGRIVAAGVEALDTSLDDAAKLWQEIGRLNPVQTSPQIAASLLAAAEIIVDRAAMLLVTTSELAPALLGSSEVSTSGLAALAQLIAVLKPTNSSPTANELGLLIANAELLAARAAALLGHYDTALVRFSVALALAEQHGPRAGSEVWHDWLPPVDSAARTLLEFALALHPSFLSLDDTLANLAQYHGGLSDIDNDRLHSLRLQLHMKRGLVTHAELEDEGWLGAQQPGGDALAHTLSCYAHRRVPPLFVAVAEALMGLGYLADGLLILRNVSLGAGEFTAETTRYAGRTVTYASLFLRLPDADEAGAASLALSPRATDRVLLRAAQLWSGSRVEADFDPTDTPIPTNSLSEEALRRWLRDLSRGDQPKSPSSYGGAASGLADAELELARSVGVRRAAAIALYEGTLLTLHLPDHAVALLQRAFDWYQLCQDDLGMVVAGITLALLLGAPPRVSELEPLRSVIKSAYDQLHQHLAVHERLPSWSDLASITLSVDHRQMDELLPVNWRPLLFRLLLCLHVQEHRGDRAILAHYAVIMLSSEDRQPVVLPPDIAPWFQESDFARPSTPTLPDSNEVRLHVSYGGSPGKDSGVVPRFDFDYRSQLENQTIHLQLDVHGTPLLPLPATIYRAAGGTYKDLAHAMPGRYGAVLTDITNAAPTTSLSIDISDGLDGFCWEALAALRLQNTNDANDLSEVLRFRFRRSTFPPPVARPPWRRPSVSVVGYTGSERTWEIVQRGWQQLDQDPRFNVLPEHSTKLSTSIQQMEDTTILHLVGDPEANATDLLFRISTGSQPISSTDLITRFPNLAICVLQCTPAELNPRRFDSDRLSATLARGFAARLFAKGVPVVLMLPPLPPTTATNALALIAATIRAHPGIDTQELVEAVSNIRELILGLSPSSDTKVHDDRIEMALDVCIYMMAGWDGLLTE